MQGRFGSYHEFKAGSKTFNIPDYYSLNKVIGNGAYGVVISAADRRDGKNYAIKLCQDAFRDNIDAKRILREVKLLRRFEHPNVIKIVDVIPIHPSSHKFDDIYIVQDLMETDLHRIIYSKQSLSIDHVRYFTYQLLKGLKYIHSANVIHRDLKPANLLINSNCDLKICDFGLARAIQDDPINGGLLTQYVVTRWYRAPEILLNCTAYTKAVDVWSAGCILGELLLRDALFKGSNYIQTLQMITSKLGTLRESEMSFISNARAKSFMMGLPPTSPLPMGQWFPKFKNEVQALDILRGMLTIHPDQRLTVEQCLAHPFFSSLHNPDEEPTHHQQISFAIDDTELTSNEVREEFWSEIRAYHPYIAEQYPREEAHHSEETSFDDFRGRK